jgi:hypothetical protein
MQDWGRAFRMGIGRNSMLRRTFVAGGENAFFIPKVVVFGVGIALSHDWRMICGVA